MHIDIVPGSHGVIAHAHANPAKYTRTKALTDSIRYSVTVVSGSKNPLQGAVSKDIVDAILQTKAAKGVSAKYRDKEEQKKRLEEAYNKWYQHGGIWSAATSKVYCS
jgi:hypothetical protein